MNEIRSKIGALERSIFPPLGLGKLGAVAARAGVGKSTCLTRVALGELIRGRQVLHVSLDNPVTHVRASYDIKLAALASQHPGAVPDSLRLEIERRRHIHSYMSGSFSPTKLSDGLRFLAEHVDFRPSTIVLDGFPFDRAEQKDVSGLQGIAQEAEAELWMSALAHRDEDPDQATGLPLALAPFASELEVVVSLEPQGDDVSVYLLKQGSELRRAELPVRLDPATMLLVRDDRTDRAKK